MSQGAMNATIANVERLQHFTNNGVIATNVLNNQINITGAIVKNNSGGLLAVVSEQKINSSSVSSRDVVNFGDIIITARFMKPTNDFNCSIKKGLDDTNRILTTINKLSSMYINAKVKTSSSTISRAGLGFLTNYTS